MGRSDDRKRSQRCACGAPATTGTCPVCKWPSEPIPAPSTLPKILGPLLALALVGAGLGVVNAPGVASTIDPVGEAADRCDEYPAPATDPVSIQDLLLPAAAVPAGLEPVTDPRFNGPLDLEGAANLDEETASTTRVSLEANGFEAGFQRAWTDGRTVILSVVFAFEAPEGACAFYVEQEVAIQSDPGVEDFPVPGVDGAVGYTDDGSDDPEPYYGHTVYMVRGRYVIQVLLVGIGDNRPGVDQVLPLVDAQDEVTR